MTTLATVQPGKAETEQFTIGAEVSCTGGPCGKLTRALPEIDIDHPETKKMTP